MARSYHADRRRADHGTVKQRNRTSVFIGVASLPVGAREVEIVRPRDQARGVRVGVRLLLRLPT
jgi:hypothetical protein